MPPVFPTPRHGEQKKGQAPPDQGTLLGSRGKVQDYLQTGQIPKTKKLDSSIAGAKRCLVFIHGYNKRSLDYHYANGKTGPIGERIFLGRAERVWKKAIVGLGVSNWPKAGKRERSALLGRDRSPCLKAVAIQIGEKTA